MPKCRCGADALFVSMDKNGNPIGPLCLKCFLKRTLTKEQSALFDFFEIEDLRLQFPKIKRFEEVDSHE